MEKKNKFPLEKILTISARDYCESVGKNLQDYEMKGVHIQSSSVGPKIIEELNEKIPKNTEVIVEYRFSNGGYFNVKYEKYASGTALIPKKK